MSAVKKKMDAFDIAAVVYELDKVLNGARLANIYCIDETFIFKFRRKGGNFYLIFNPEVGAYLTKYEFEVPKQPPSFVIELRRYIRGGLVSKVSQLNRDRIIVFELEKGGLKFFLVMELVREGNLILADSNLKIILALKYKKMKDRSILRGERYMPPPGGLDPLDVKLEELYNEIRKEEKERSLARAFFKILNIPPGVIKEVFYEFGEIKVNQVDSHILSAVLGKIKEMYSEIAEGRLEPNIVYRNGVPIGVYPIKMAHLGEVERKYFNSFNEALDEYFTRFLFKAKRKIRGLEKIAKQVSDVERTIEEYRNKEAEARSLAKVLMGNLHVVELTLQRIREALERGEKPLLEEIGISGVKILSLDLARKMVEAEIDGRNVILDLKKSAGENASAYFEEAKKYRRKAERAREVLEKLREKLRVESEAEESEKIVLKLRRAKKWYEKFRWFISSDGFLVVGGRDASQNEALVKKYMESSDIFLHAVVYGSPAVIIKAENRPVPKRTILEAAQFTASYSRAWEAGFFSADVYWVYPSQVSKKTPSGEYMGKGSFMIYGKRNYLRKVPLALAIGLVLKNSSLEILYGPPPPIAKKAQFYVLLLPGKMDREKAAARVLERLRLQVLNYFKEKKVLFKIDRQQILELLPKGRFHVVEKPEKVLEQIERYYVEEIGEKASNNRR